jgi:hypothetical protein
MTTGMMTTMARMTAGDDQMMITTTTDDDNVEGVKQDSRIRAKEGKDRK